MEFSWQEYWVALPFSRRSSRRRDHTQFSCIEGRLLTVSHPGAQLWSILKCKWTRRKTSLSDNDLLSVFYISGAELNSGDLKIGCCLRW